MTKLSEEAVEPFLPKAPLCGLTAGRGGATLARMNDAWMPPTAEPRTGTVRCASVPRRLVPGHAVSSLDCRAAARVTLNAHQQCALM